MSLAMVTCMICQKTITRQFRVCAECEDAYSLGPKRQWPKWARQLHASHAAEERQEMAILEHEAGSPSCVAFMECISYGYFVDDNF